MTATDPLAGRTDDEGAARDAEGSGPVFWVGAVAGAAIVAFGVHGLWVEERRGVPSAARWLVGGALALDLVVVPLLAVIGWIAKRWVPAWTWPIVRAVLAVSALLIVFAAPLALHQGGVSGNPTVRPRDYTTGLVGALVVTWAVGAIMLAVAGVRRR